MLERTARAGGGSIPIPTCIRASPLVGQIRGTAKGTRATVRGVPRRPQDHDPVTAPLRSDRADHRAPGLRRTRLAFSGPTAAGPGTAGQKAPGLPGPCGAGIGPNVAASGGRHLGLALLVRSLWLRRGGQVLVRSRGRSTSRAWSRHGHRRLELWPLALDELLRERLEALRLPIEGPRLLLEDPDQGAQLLLQAGGRLRTSAAERDRRVDSERHEDRPRHDEAAGAKQSEGGDLGVHDGTLSPPDGVVASQGPQPAAATPVGHSMRLLDLRASAPGCRLAWQRGPWVEGGECQRAWGGLFFAEACRAWAGWAHVHLRHRSPSVARAPRGLSVVTRRPRGFKYHPHPPSKPSR